VCGRLKIITIVGVKKYHIYNKKSVTEKEKEKEKKRKIEKRN